jgi:hypothetical protein
MRNASHTRTASLDLSLFLAFLCHVQRLCYLYSISKTALTPLTRAPPPQRNRQALGSCLLRFRLGSVTNAQSSEQLQAPAVLCSSTILIIFASARYDLSSLQRRRRCKSLFECIRMLRRTVLRRSSQGRARLPGVLPCEPSHHRHLFDDCSDLRPL